MGHICVCITVKDASLFGPELKMDHQLEFGTVHTCMNIKYNEDQNKIILAFSQLQHAFTSIKKITIKSMIKANAEKNKKNKIK